MSKLGWIDDHFRRRLKEERERRGWRQQDLAEKLAARKVYIHETAIAKIEKGTRYVRIDEAAAFADLFGISTDAMLGRLVRLEIRQARALMLAADTAVRSSSALVDVALAVRDRIDDLSAFDGLPARDELIADYERVYSLLVDANGALLDVQQTRRTASRQLRGAR
jgi:transcriptional regulator with XRE-family HTH domain